MTFEDVVNDWKSHDDWQFADKEACWKFMFENGQESLRQQLAAAVAACKLKDEALKDLLEFATYSTCGDHP